jgi:hypothetical protein
MNDFYIGYLPKAPNGLGRFLRRVIGALGVLAISIALVLVMKQMRFANSVFEYGKRRSFEGTIAAVPYPSLLVERPGMTGQQSKYSRYLLVAPGKHGADDLVAGFDGKKVRVQGQLIYREGGTMVEITPGAITLLDSVPADQESTRNLGAVTVTGEIVDSKCFLGVMNPGQGKVHRDCAARCLSGGVPPIFVTSNGIEQFLLVDPEGHALGHDALREFVADPIIIHGELLQRGESRLLMIDATALTHMADRIQKPAQLAERHE